MLPKEVADEQFWWSTGCAPLECPFRSSNRRVARCGSRSCTHGIGAVHSEQALYLRRQQQLPRERLATTGAEAGRLTAKLAPFKGKVNVKIVNSQSTKQAQIADLNSIIQTKPDAIMLIPGPSTAMNPTIKRACDAGILVFTISAPVTEPCAWNVEPGLLRRDDRGRSVDGEGPEGKGQRLRRPWHPWPRYLQGHRERVPEGLKQDGPNIKVIGTFNGQYAPGPEQSGISSLLVGTPDVNGVMTQGYCTPVFNAFKQADKRCRVPATCYGYNGELGACAQSGHACAILSGSPVVMQIAMKVGSRRARGQAAPPKNKIIPVPMTLFITRHPEGRPQRGSVKVEIDQGREELLPQPSRWSCAPVHVAAVQDHPEPGSGEIAEQSRGN